MSRDELIALYRKIIVPPLGTSEEERNDWIFKLASEFKGIGIFEIESNIPDLDFSNLWENPKAENKYVEMVIDIALKKREEVKN